MSISGGACRLHYVAQHEQGSSISFNGRDQQQRRRSRRQRNDDSAQQQQQQKISPNQPNFVMIQFEQHNSSGSSRTIEQSPGIILCSWLPTSLPLHHLISKEGEKVESKAGIGTNILEFDERVAIVLKDGRKDWRIDGLLRSCSDDNAKAEGVDGNPGSYESWILGETDPESVRNLSSTNDRLDNYTNNPSFQRRYLTIENNPGRPCRGHKGVAIPFSLPSVNLRPLQSMVISIVGLASHVRHPNSDSEDRMSILMQSFWKRQLVGKVVAFEEPWTSRIALAAGIHDDGNMTTDGGSKHSGEGIQSAIYGSTVYAVIESCTPLRLNSSASTLSSKRGDDRNGRLFLPNNFYVILPSTYITILPASPQSSVQSPSTEINLDRNPSSKSTTLCRKSLLGPPTDAASLLMDTLHCIRSRFVGDGGGDVPRTFLMSGPPGVGKTFSVSWVATAHPDTVLSSIRGSELLQGTATSKSSSIEGNISPARALEREFLKMVQDIALRERQNTEDGGAVVGLFFLDECDALVSVDPIAAMLANLLDRVSSSTAASPSSSEQGETDDLERYWKRILVVGATNRIDSIPSYLRRAGRFDRELPMSPPTAKKRAELLHSMLKNLQSNDSSNDMVSGTEEEKTNDLTLPLSDEIQEIAELCVGYVAADLSALVRKAWLLSLQDDDGHGNRAITVSHLDRARNFVVASALRDALMAAPPKITWDDIAGDPGGAKTALRQAIEWPRLKAREFAMLGLQPCRGILLHGPPGCAKTTLARAAAGSSGVAFLSLSPAQVYASSYVGEAERIVRQSFHLARSTAPCILFFDEIDSIFGDGSTNGGSLGGSGRGSSAEARVLSTFLNEMDGVDIAGAGKDGVLVLGATNRPWTLDPALLRPGRLGDKIIFLPPPDLEARHSIFKRQFGNASSANNNETKDEMNWDLDFSILVELSEGMTGAEIVGACQEAKIQWMREAVLSENEGGFQQQDCIVNALMSIKPLLSNPEALEEFQVFENRDKKNVH